jgi:hypothetical protein
LRRLGVEIRVADAPGAADHPTRSKALS